MTQATDNVALLAGLYKAFAHGDVPTVLAAFDDKIEWNEAEGNPYNQGHAFVGPAAVVEGVFARVMNDIDGFEIRRERTEDEHRHLIERAGLTFHHVVATLTPISFVVATV